MKKNPFNDVMNEKQLDELFRDYYRHRDNSILQLVMLLFSKADIETNENPQKTENTVHEIPESFDNNSIFT